MGSCNWAVEEQGATPHQGRAMNIVRNIDGATPV